MIEDVILTTENCRYCLMCRHVCPVGHVTRLETLTPHGWGLTIASIRRGIVSGLVVVGSIRNPADGSYLDFDDNTFKTSGWTSKTTSLSEFSAGFYGTTVDMTTVTNLPVTPHLVAEYSITGRVRGIVSHIITFRDYLTTTKFIGLHD